MNVQISRSDKRVDVVQSSSNRNPVVAKSKSGVLTNAPHITRRSKARVDLDKDGFDKAKKAVPTAAQLRVRPQNPSKLRSSSIRGTSSKVYTSTSARVMSSQMVPSGPPSSKGASKPSTSTTNRRSTNIDVASRKGVVMLSKTSTNTARSSTSVTARTSTPTRQSLAPTTRSSSKKKPGPVHLPKSPEPPKSPLGRPISNSPSKKAPQRTRTSASAKDSRVRLHDTMMALQAKVCKEEQDARADQLQIILEHLLNISGTQDHSDAVWSFVTNLVLRASYLDADIKNASSADARAVTKGFDQQLKVGLNNLWNKLQVAQTPLPSTPMSTDLFSVSFDPRRASRRVDISTQTRPFLQPTGNPMFSLSQSAIDLLTDLKDSSSFGLESQRSPNIQKLPRMISAEVDESIETNVPWKPPPLPDDSDHIRVIVRVRPLPKHLQEDQRKKCTELVSDSTLKLITKSQAIKVRMYTFDAVIAEKMSQETVFFMAGKEMVDSFLNGYNGTIFAYGQTGSGKTYTMNGPDNGTTEVSKGVMPRCFDYLFNTIGPHLKSTATTSISVRCSFLEIYNEKIIDLLAADTDRNSYSGLLIGEDPKRGVLVKGLVEHDIKSAAAANKYLAYGLAHRQVASTKMNRESSRSHAVFTLHIIRTNTRSNGTTSFIESRLNLIDLAGSERQKETKTRGIQLKEANYINKSLSALGNVITALVDVSAGKTRHIAYRDSKLTHLLKDSLGGNTKTIVIANINPLESCLSETVSTLQFAQRAKLIDNQASVNEEIKGSMKSLEKEVQRLQTKLSSRSREASPKSSVKQFARPPPLNRGRSSLANCIASATPPSSATMRSSNLSRECIEKVAIRIAAVATLRGMFDAKVHGRGELTLQAEDDMRFDSCQTKLKSKKANKATGTSLFEVRSSSSQTDTQPTMESQLSSIGAPLPLTPTPPFLCGSPLKLGTPPLLPPPLPHGSSLPPTVAGVPPPPPPPPPGLSPFTVNMINTQKIPDGPVATCQMKKFNWVSVDVLPSSQSIWTQLDKSSPVKLDFSEIEKLFGLSTPKKDLKRQGAISNVSTPTSGSSPLSNASSKHDSRETLLDSNQHIQVTSVLKLFHKMGPKDIVDAAIRLDADSFTSDQLEALGRVLSDSKLRTVIERLAHVPEESLADTDKFIYKMFHTKLMAVKIDLLLLHIEFTSVRDNFDNQINKLNSLANIIMRPEPLPQIFGIVLHLGNFLNGSARNGSQSGFATKSLLRLEDTRSNEGGSTLLHTVVKYTTSAIVDVKQKMKKILTLAEDVKNIDIYTFQNGINSFSRRVVRIRNLNVKADDVPDWCENFVSVVHAEASRLTESLANIKAKLDKLKVHLAADDLSDSITHIRCFAERFLVIYDQQLLAESKRTAISAKQTQLSSLHSPNLPLSPLRNASGEDTNYVTIIEATDSFFSESTNNSLLSPSRGSPRRRRRKSSAIGGATPPRRGGLDTSTSSLSGHLTPSSEA